MKKQRGNPFIGCEQSKNATNQNKGTGVTEETFHILGGGDGSSAIDIIITIMRFMENRDRGKDRFKQNPLKLFLKTN